MAQTGTSVGDIFLDLRIKDKTAEGIEKGAKNADKTANQRGIKTGSIFSEGFTKGLKNLVGATAIIGGVVAISKKLIDVGMEAAEASNRLAVTMHNATGATAEQVEKIMNLTEAYQKLGVVSADAQQAGLQELATYVSRKESIERMLPVLNDMLAQQYGYNATAEAAVSISTMLGKVLQGQTAALSRYGYTFDEAQEKILKYGTEEQRVATLAEVVSQSVGGMNQALGNTPEGKIVQLRNNFGQLAEQLGSFLINVLSPIISFLNMIAIRLNDILGQVNALFGRNGTSGVINSLRATGAAAAQAYEEAGDAAEKASDQMGLASFDKLNVIGKTETNTPAVNTPSVGGSSLGDIAGLTEQAKEMQKLNWREMFDQWQNDIHNGWQKVLKWIQGINWRDVWNNVWDTIWTAVSSIHWGDLFIDIFESLGTAVGTVYNFLEQGIETLHERLEEAITNYFRPFIEDAGGNVIKGLLEGILAGLVNIDLWIMEHIVDPFMEGLLGCFGIEWLPIKEKIGMFFFDLCMKIDEWFTKGWEDLKKKFEPIVKWVDEHIIQPAKKAFEDLKEFLRPFGEWFENQIIKPIAKIWKKLFGEDIQKDSKDAKDNIESDWEDTPSFFEGILNLLSGNFAGTFADIASSCFDYFGDIRQTISDTVSDAGNWLSDLWDSATSYTRSIGSRIGSAFSGFSFPHFATGGYVDQPTIAMVGEGNQGEYIIPEDKLASIVAKVLGEGNKISGGTSNTSAEGQTINITLELDGTVLARKQIKEFNRMSKAQGKPVFDF